MACYEEVLPATKSSKHSGIRWTPAEADYEPVAGTLVIDTDRSRVEYVVHEFPTGWLGRGFQLLKLTEGTDKAEESYSVFCSQRGGPEADSCECKGFAYHGTCKHVAALRALLANDWI